MMRPDSDWDAVVIGAGPAGSIAALGLARSGHRVLLMERSRWPRSKVCGSCLNGLALHVLAEAGLGSLVADCGGRPLDTVVLHAGPRRARLPLPTGAALSRAVFDAALVREATRAGAVFLPETVAAVGQVAGDHRQVILRQGADRVAVQARVVLATTGLGAEAADTTVLPRATVNRASRIGAGATIDTGSDDYRPGIVYMASGRQGYVGLVRIESGALDVAAALDPAAVRARGNIGVVIRGVLEEAGLPVPSGATEADWRGTPALTRTRTRLGAERLFIAGDAAGYVEPFTGEGIGWALASGQALIPLAQQAIHVWQGDEVQRWERYHRDLIARRQFICRTLRPLLRSPVGVRTGVALLGRSPALARPVIRRINAALPVEGAPA